MAYTVVRTDNLSGIVDGSKLRTVRFYNSSDAAAAIENGAVIAVGDRLTVSSVAVDRDLRKATAVAYTGLGKAALIATPELVYADGWKSLDEFTNAAEADCLAYILEQGDEFSITAGGFSGTPSAGKYVYASDTGKLTIESTATKTVGDDTYNALGKVLGSDTENGFTFWLVEIL